MIGGDITKLAIVQTNPGYAANPGHSGTGTVVAVICQQSLASNTKTQSVFTEGIKWFLLMFYAA